VSGHRIPYSGIGTVERKRVTATNGLKRLGRAWSTTRCVVALVFALLIILSHPSEGPYTI
jgi:hypothetical protein